MICLLSNYQFDSGSIYVFNLTVALMLATFGVEVIHDFNNYRKSGIDGADEVGDAYWSYDIGNGFVEQLSNAGHTAAFYNINNYCYEIDLRDPSAGGGGIDYEYADNVNLFFIVSHGNRYPNGVGYVSFNTKFNEWNSDSRTWRLGDRCSCDWLMVYGCSLVDKNNILPYVDRFQGLHEICAGWDTMYGFYTTDECGSDVADNMIDGDTVSDAWIDGVSDWFLDNHPIVIAAETKDAYDNGNVIWSQTTMNNDHFWGHGFTVNDIKRSDLFMLTYHWAEG
jgi:Family of unknown function (DUF6345)